VRAEGTCALPSMIQRVHRIFIPGKGRCMHRLLVLACACFGSVTGVVRLAGDRSPFAPATCQASIVTRSMSVLTADMAALHVFFCACRYRYVW